MYYSAESSGGRDMSKRKTIVICTLCAISAIAFCVPYSFNTICTQQTALALTACFFRNAAVSVFRYVPLLFALLLLPARKKPDA
jgi:hypothetical protein